MVRNWTRRDIVARLEVRPRHRPPRRRGGRADEGSYQNPSRCDGGVFLTGVTDSPDKVLSPGREQTPEDVMVAIRRAALLPRCYVAYSSSEDKRMTASNWTTLLTVSGVFEAERVKVLKADLIFSVLSRDGALGYRAFRQALRQVAVTLYPELGEGDAFRRLVEEDVLPRATLASESEARDAGLLGVS